MLSTAAKSAISPAVLSVLLVGNQEEDFFLIREILERYRMDLPAVLDHALRSKKPRRCCKRVTTG